MPRLRVEAEVGANVNPLERAFKKAEGSGSKFASSLKSKLAAAFSVGAIVAFTKNLSDSVAEIKDMAAQLRESTDEAQKLNFEFGLTGLGFGEVVQVFNALAQQRQRALQGNQDMIASFESLGISVNKLQRLEGAALLKGIFATSELNIDSVRDLLGAEILRKIEALQNFANPDRNRPSFFGPKDIQSIDEATKELESARDALEVGAASFLANILRASRELTSLNFGKAQVGVGRAFIEGTTIGKAASEVRNALKRRFFPDEVSGEALPLRRQRAMDPGLMQGPFGGEEMNDLQTRLIELDRKLAISQMTTAQRRLSIESEISELRQESALTESEIERSKLAVMIKERQLQLAGLGESESESGFASPASDALARIGGFVGPTGQGERDRNGRMILRTIQQIERQLNGPGIKIDE